LLPYAIIRAESLCAISKMTCAVNEGMEIANYLLTTPFLCYRRNNHFLKGKAFLNDDGKHEERASGFDRIIRFVATRSPVPEIAPLAHRF
ncbi:MAG: hypothetical protein NTV99_01875, partial [Deltaproteobacteria bacterium]|nr:hypothetical protein [Deltaproteobacteria bacterium]